MMLNREEKLELLKVELPLIQSRFDKYDDLSSRGRNIAVTITVASIGAAFAYDESNILLLSTIANIAFLFLEWFNKHYFFNKLVERHEVVRAVLNGKIPLDDIVIYDPFNDFSQLPAERINCLPMLRMEMYIFYGVLIILPFAVWIVEKYVQ